jgi:hypothetical protein
VGQPVACRVLSKRSEVVGMRFAIRLYLLWLRLELVLVAILPAGLIVESSIANMAAYGDGLFGFLRGLFFEVVTYASARTAKLIMQKERGRRRLSAVFLGLIAAFAMYVSAVNNLGWVLTGHDLGGFFFSLGRVLPPGMFGVYKVGLAILLPLAVAGIALVDLDHFVHDVLAKDAFDVRAMEVEESEMHRKAYLRSQRKQQKVIQQEYHGIAERRARTFVQKASGGDLSFSSRKAPVSTVQNVAASPVQQAIAAAPVPMQRPVVRGATSPSTNWSPPVPTNGAGGGQTSY